MKHYLEQALDGFLNDPPSSDFQRGYLAAILECYKQLDNPDMNLYEEGEALLKGSVQ